jgi:hypothetical protein
MGMRPALVVVGVFAARTVWAQPPTPGVALSCSDETCSASIYVNTSRVRACAEDSALRTTKKDRRQPPRLVTEHGASIAMAREGSRWCATVPLDIKAAIVTPSATRKLALTSITPTGLADMEVSKTGWTRVGDVDVAVDDPTNLLSLGITDSERKSELTTAKALYKEPADEPPSGADVRDILRRLNNTLPSSNDSETRVRHAGDAAADNDDGDKAGNGADDE